MTEQDVKVEEAISAEEHNELIDIRRNKLAELRKKGQAFPNDFIRDALAADIHSDHDDADGDALKEQKIMVKVAGRMMLRRIMGKASFATIQDVSGRIQLYIRRDDIQEGLYPEFKHWDLGDIVGAEGYVFKTKTGELSIHVTELRLLSKSIRPLPDKFHGLHDQEACYRQRYLDLMVNEQTRKTFKMRSDMTVAIRQFMRANHYFEVETPMMQSLPGGATAKPFVTHHNTLDMQLYMRVAPELFLKRLIVGGFERVFEINRNFRNEGMSTRHNPEFTMIEFYQAYATYHDMIDLTENMMRHISQEILGSTTVHYQGEDYDLSKPFAQMTVVESILHYNPDLKLSDIDSLESARKTADDLKVPFKDSYGLGKVQIEIFEKTVEHRLMAPTFITEYPVEVSPLARRNNDNPEVADRFEFFVGGRELANGFSELNDPEDQAERFKKQVEEKAAGDDEAMPYDEDYIVALEQGMPPTAGEGIGIDRLAMFFADQSSIRDVILFPLMRDK